MDCPLDLAPDDSNRSEVLSWLLSYAVSLEYADNGEGDGWGLRHAPAAAADHAH
jgi:hypothetical protein